MPHAGGLYDQDAEFVEWYYKFTGYLAEAGNQPVGGNESLSEAQEAVTRALLSNQ